MYFFYNIHIVPCIFIIEIVRELLGLMTPDPQLAAELAGQPQPRGRWISQ